MTKPATTSRRFKEAVKRWGPECFYCGRPAQTTDHFIPKVMGGPSAKDNYRPSCIFCNQVKSDKHPDIFLFVINMHGPPYEWSRKIIKNLHRGVYDEEYYKMVDSQIRRAHKEMKRKAMQEEIPGKPTLEDSFTGMPRTQVRGNV